MQKMFSGFFHSLPKPWEMMLCYHVIFKNTVLMDIKTSAQDMENLD